MARSYTNPAPGPLGTTFTGAGGQANNVLYVAANGQTLSRSAYPELASLYSNQSQQFVGSFIDNSTSTYQLPQATPNNGLCYDSTSTYTIYSQQVNWNSTTGYVLWKTTNGTSWSLHHFELDNGTLNKVVAIGNDIYICRTTGLYRVTNGTGLQQIYSGNISDICTNGTTFLLANVSSTLLSTTDFVTYTNVSPGVTGRGCLFFNTRYWVFSNSTTIRYSSDLVTWTSAPITLPVSSQGQSQRVINGMIFSFNQNSGQPIFRYNSDPLVNAWSSSGSNYSNMGPVTGMIYDSSTTSYILSHTFNTVSGPFAWVFTNIAAAGSQVISNTIPGSNTDVIATNYGTNKSYHITTQYSVGSTTWLTGSQDYSQTNTYQNPFLSGTALGTSSSGGVTTLNKRWLFKCVGDTGAGSASSGIMVEENGVFVELRNTTADPWPIQSGGSVQSWVVFYEDANGYAMITGSGSSTYYWASIGTNKRTISSSSSATPSATSSHFVPVKGVGIHIFSGASTTSRQVYNLTTANTASPSIRFTYSLVTTSSMLFYQLLENEGEIVTTELNATASSQPTCYVLKNGNVSSQFTISLFNTAGSSISVTSDCKIYKFNGAYYASNNGVLYFSASGGPFNQIGTTISTNTSSLNASVQSASNVSIGMMNIYNYFGSIVITQPNGSISTTWGPAPKFIPLNGTVGFVGYFNGGSQSGYRYGSSTNAATQFIVPNITSTTAGQGVYIVAR